MPGPKRSYTDEDRARVYAYLNSNDGNVLRTSKETGVPQQTVRVWKKKWLEGGLSPKVEAALPAVQGDITTRFEGVRDQVLDRIIELIPEAKPNHLGSLNSIWGTLQDKLDRMNGKPNRTVEINHTVTHQTTDEQAALLAALAQKTLGDYDQRRDIIDVEVEEQPLAGLPAPTDRGES